MERQGDKSSRELTSTVRVMRGMSDESGKLFNRSSLRNWADVSRVNFIPSGLDRGKSRQSSVRGQVSLPSKQYLSSMSVMHYFHKNDEDAMEELIPVNVTSLMNEGQHWGCFYNFPELYSDAYSPTVRILKPEDIDELVNGVLTRDMIATCLTYPKRTPILGDFVYIKLNLSGKHLLNIDILQHYRYLVYLDLSSNLLTDLSVLSFLLYLQFLSVAFNRLNTVLEYSTPQWFLTEVHYKYNSVKKIRDLDMFWSITILDLSHNNIKSISGLQNLRYLRHLDLSFNHIQRLENLNNLRLLWLDLSYNNISTFEFNNDSGLWTLLDLQYLNLNENSLKSLKMFSGCTRLRELHMRNNRVSILLELAVYMRQCRWLLVLDLRANPLCSTPGYQDVAFEIFPLLLSLDAMELDPQHQRSSMMDTLPEVRTFASRRLLRLLYVEQLGRARVSPLVPPADTTDVPLIVLVGTEGSGKGTLARRLATEWSAKVQLALQHTTATFHYPDHYKEIKRDKFDDMLLAGEFLTYSEVDGESYGLSREEAYVSGGRVRVCSMDLVGALMLKLRGLQPYLILASVTDKQVLSRTQRERREARNYTVGKRLSLEPPHDHSTLQVMLSGRIIITGILNEILVALPDEKGPSEFMIESECSLFMDSEARQAGHAYARGANLLNLITSSSSSLEEVRRRSAERYDADPSLYSLYKESQNDVDGATSSHGQSSYDFQTNTSKHTPKKKDSRRSEQKTDNAAAKKSYDFSRYTSSTWKGIPQDSTKSSKSVTFTSQSQDAMGLIIEVPTKAQDKAAEQKGKDAKSVSHKLIPCPSWPSASLSPAPDGVDDLDLWLTFLVNTGLLQASEVGTPQSDNLNIKSRHNTTIDNPSSIIRQMGYYVKTPYETVTTTLKDEYEGIHRLLPGLFWDTIIMDDPNAAFLKAKRIIKNIVEEQRQLKPLFDIDFPNLANYPTVEKRLNDIRQQIAPHLAFN